MAEKLNLSTPDQVKAGTSDYQIIDLGKHRGLRWDVPTSALVAVPAESTIRVVLIGAAGLLREEWITSADNADALLITLNKANLNPATGGKTEQKRVLEWLATNRPTLNGTTVTGTAD